MKQLEFQRLNKIVVDLKAIHKKMDESPAKKALTKLVTKLEAKLSANGKDGKVVKPKRPLSAFSKFVKDHMSEVVASHPKASPPERMKLLGKMYREQQGDATRGRARSRSPSPSRKGRSPSPAKKAAAKKPAAKK